MCGIIGYLGGSRLDALTSGLHVISHRGPDDHGIYYDKNIGLGHARLSILDVSALGHQPMASFDERFVLVFNGEIFNFKDLRDELRIKGYEFKSLSDTEVVLNLYLEEGEKMLSRLNGIFSLAIWDRTTQTLLIARDALGVKPLYYLSTINNFIFSSEIKAFLPFIQETEGELDIPQIHRYMSFLSCPGDGTPFKFVKKLLPGHAMVIAGGGEIVKKWDWYRLPVFHPKPLIQSKQKVLSETLIHLTRAVERQMVSDVPIGAFLSGGLDSSSIVALASRLNPNINCFTIDMAEGGGEGMVNDLPYARKVAKHLGVPLEVIQISSTRMAERLEEMVFHMDEPLADPAALNVLFISELAKEHGIKVLLSGTGGDDLFTGYRRHRALQAERYWDWLPLAVRYRLSKGCAQLNQSNTFFRRLNKAFSGAQLVGDARLINYFRWMQDDNLLPLYTEDFKRALGSEDSEKPMIDFLASMPSESSQLEKMLALEQRFFLSDHNLLYTDKMSMAVGVEVRVPFLDLDLVDFASRIPASMKQRGGTGKWVLKKIMEPYLPKDVIYRPKTGFGAPLRRWIRFELRDLLGDLLSVSSLNSRGFFNPEAIHKLIARNDLGEIDASYTLLSLMCIEIWCRKFVDDPAFGKMRETQ